MILPMRPLRVVPLRALSLALTISALLAGCATTGSASSEGADPGSRSSTQDGSTDANRRPTGDDARVEAAVRRAQDGDLTRAEQELRELVARNPSHDLAWTNLGILHERLGQEERAVDDYTRALERAPGQTAANLNLARLLARRGQVSRAESEARARAEKHPDAHGARLGLVQALLLQKKTVEAATEAKRVLRVEEQNVRAMELLAAAWFAEEKVELARMVLENARAIDGKDAAIHNALGLVQLKMNERPQALESFKTASSLQPDLAEARNNHGALLNEAQDFDAAVVELRAAVQSAPGDVAAHLNLGNALRGKGEAKAAQAAYEKALALDPELEAAWFNLGILYLDAPVPEVDDLARYRQALSWFETYKKRGGKDEELSEYLRDATRAIEREERRLEREQKAALRRAQQAESEAKAAQQAAQAASDTAKGATAATDKKDAPASATVEASGSPP